MGDNKSGHGKANIVQQGNIIYLRVGTLWYAYDYTDKPLGSGAMGTVYRGWRTDNKQHVAIKQVIPAYADIPSIRQRARIESSMIFNHPHVVEMLGCCEWAPDHGPMFIISALVNGITLDEHINKHRLRELPDSTKRICETAFPVLDALDYLHSKDIIHLDIKPSNIMLENGYNIRLMDLGIAFTHDAIELTSPGILGTPQYAAPEQVLEPGRNRLEIDRTTDIYELGVTLYELLAGSNPYNAPTLQQTIMRQRTELLPNVDGVPPKVMKVLRKATEKRKADRFQSAAEFKAALQDALKPHHGIFSWLIGR